MCRSWSIITCAGVGYPRTANLVAFIPHLVPAVFQCCTLINADQNEPLYYSYAIFVPLMRKKDVLDCE